MFHQDQLHAGWDLHPADWQYLLTNRSVHNLVTPGLQSVVNGYKSAQRCAAPDAFDTWALERGLLVKKCLEL